MIQKGTPAAISAVQDLFDEMGWLQCIAAMRDISLTRAAVAKDLNPPDKDDESFYGYVSTQCAQILIR